METYLYYSYLKFRHDNQKPVCVIMKCIPWWVWVLLASSLAGLGIGVALSQTDAPKMWYKIAMILSICSLGLLNVGIEYIQIADGDKRYKNYWTRIKGVQDFLLQKGISSQEDVTEIKSRAEQRLAQRKLELKALRESDEKCLQTLAIPVLLLILTTMVEKSGELNDMISSAITIFLFSGVLSLLVFLVVTTMRYMRTWEISNLSLYVDDLQGVLDLPRFGSAEEENS